MNTSPRVSRNRLLVVSQRSDRTGAPVQLGVLLDGLEQAAGMRITLLLGSSGALAPTLASHASKVKRELWLFRVVAAAGRRAPARIERFVQWTWERAMRAYVGHHDLVYVNSLSSRHLAKPFLDLPTVVHVHEIGTFAEASGEAGRELVNRARLVAVPSRVAEEWVTGAGADLNRVIRIPGALAESAFEAADPVEVQRLAARLSIPPDALVVTSVGWIGEMKGSDRFLEVARLLADKQADRTVRMLWAGGDVTTRAGARFESEVDRAGLRDVVVIAPTVADIRSVYGLSTVVLIASREESLSLVALEAAAQHTPVVAFPGAGGPDELAQEGIVLLSDGADAENMAALIVRLFESPDGASEQSHISYRALMEHHRGQHGQARLAEALRQVSSQ